MYLDKFQTPLTVETISSRGSNFRFLFSSIAPRSFNSRYILLELNALKFVIFIRYTRISITFSISLVNTDDRGEESRAPGQQVGENELKSRVITLGQQIQRLSHPAQLRVDSLGCDVQDAAVSHS